MLIENLFEFGIFCFLETIDMELRSVLFAIARVLM